jgi:hypothetical protein
MQESRIEVVAMSSERLSLKVPTAVGKLALRGGALSPQFAIAAAPDREAMYTTLLMSTGLTFGTISSLFGLSHGIIDRDQCSALVAAVIGSAVIPTVIANAFYLPRHLLPKQAPATGAEPGRIGDSHVQ